MNGHSYSERYYSSIEVSWYFLWVKFLNFIFLFLFLFLFWWLYTYTCVFDFYYTCVFGLCLFHVWFGSYLGLCWFMFFPSQLFCIVNPILLSCLLVCSWCVGLICSRSNFAVGLILRSSSNAVGPILRIECSYKA